MYVLWRLASSIWTHNSKKLLVARYNHKNWSMELVFQFIQWLMPLALRYLPHRKCSRYSGRYGYDIEIRPYKAVTEVIFSMTSFWVANFICKWCALSTYSKWYTLILWQLAFQLLNECTCRRRKLAKLANIGKSANRRQNESCQIKTCVENLLICNRL